MKKIALVVINPASGNGRAQQLWMQIKNKPELLQSFTETARLLPPFQWDTLQTTADESWKSTLWKKLQISFPSTLIVIGGDGTLHDVLNFLHQKFPFSPWPSILPLPGGRGNDFVRGLYAEKNVMMSLRPKTFIEWAGDQTSPGTWSLIPADAIQTHDRIFFNVASLGYGGQIVQKLQNSDAIWHRWPFAYQAQGALSFFNEKEKACTLQVDGHRVYEGAFFGAFIGNGTVNGAGLFWFSQAQISDGRMDCLLFPKPSPWHMLQSLGKIRSAKDPTFEHLRFQGREFSFHLKPPGALECDGTFLCEAAHHGFKCLPGKFSLWVLKK